MSTTTTTSASSTSSNNPTKRDHVVVIVLGDIGRSPRMQYHTISLLQQNLYDVTLIGYTGEKLVPFLQSYNNNNNNNNNTTSTDQSRRPILRIIRFLPPTFRKFLDRIPLLYFVWRIISLSIALLYILLSEIPSSQTVDCILIQNPPAIPLFAVLYIYKQIKIRYQKQSNNVSIIIDWHNLGYTMLRKGSIIQRLAKRYEYYFAPKIANGHLTVTKAMKNYILDNILINNTRSASNVSVLYDCPPDIFGPLELYKQHEVLCKLHNELKYAIPKSWNIEYRQNTMESIDDNGELKNYQTIFTGYDTVTQLYQPRWNRPALVTSSTSWTPDEDFGLLLDALIQLQERITTEQSSLKVMVVVTGKGPEKQMYLEKISKLQLTSIAIQTIWLEPVDYPKLLACADLGISLHTSTSNLDLPMKVLDLYGCYTPVCAYNYPCLNELVIDGTNGRTFETSTELSNQLYELLAPLVPDDNDINNNTEGKRNHNYGKLKDYSQALVGRERWDTNWIANALPVIQKAIADAASTATTE